MNEIQKRAFRSEDLLKMDYYDRSPSDYESSRYLETIEPNVTFIQCGKVVLCGGLNIFYPGCAEAWIFISKNPGASVPMGAKILLDQWIRQYHLRRVQALTLADWKEGRRFLEWLGMRCEADRMIQSSVDGKDQAMYARVI